MRRLHLFIRKIQKNPFCGKHDHFIKIRQNIKWFHSDFSQKWGGEDTFTLSHFHTFTLSHFHTFTISHFHTLTLSHFHTFTLSHFHTLTLSHFHTLTLSHSHSLTLSHSLSLDMLNKFCFHLYAQKSLFIAENCNGFFWTPTPTSPYPVTLEFIELVPS